MLNTNRYRFTFMLLLLFVLTACGGGGGNSAVELPPSTFKVDASVQPSAVSLPGFNGIDERPLAAMSDENGNVVEFVSNERWVMTEDSAEEKKKMNH